MTPTSDNERVRDHLANERTYLAWMRTGISTMGFGVVIAKLRYIFPPSALTPPTRGIVHASNIGLVFTVIGLVIVTLSSRRYLITQEQIRQQRYTTSNRIVVLFSAVVSVLGLLIIWYLAQGTVTP
jgi:putative membrane protein